VLEPDENQPVVGRSGAEMGAYRMA